MIYENIHVKWTMSKKTAVVHMSIDSGQTWKTGDSWYSVYTQNFGQYKAWRKECYSADIPSILRAKEKFVRDRASERAKLKREAFKVLAPELQNVVLEERQAIKSKRQACLQARNEVSTSVAMKQLLEFGPELIKLREKIDDVVELMSKGGINKEFPFYDRTVRDIRLLNKVLDEKVQKHIRTCQKRKRK